MSKQLKIRSFIVLFAMVASIIGTALPAFAAFGATASVDIAEVLSGQQNTFLFTVTNTGVPGTEIPPSAGDPAINWVRIGPATSGGDGTFTPEAAAAGGWTPGLQDLDDDGTMDAAVFRGGSIAAADNHQFTVVASAADIPVDDTVRWTVEISQNAGQNISEATAVGNLQTTIRVLSVESVAVTAPSGVATDGTATADQPNLQYESIVKNYGTGTLSVDPSLASSNTDDQITDQTAASVGPDGTHTFTFPVDLANATGDRTFTGDASAPGADALSDLSPTLTVQAVPSFTYANNTLQPRAAVSGATKTFTLTVNKSNPPGVTFDAANTTLTLTNQADSSKSFSTDIASPTSVGTGNGAQALTFADVSIPGDALARDFDGTYTPSLRIEGTDSNDAPFAQTVSVGNTFEIDNLIPDVDPNILGPGCPGATCQVDPDNVPTAKDGQTLTFSGSINKGADPPNNVADTAAVVTNCFLVVTDLAGIELSRTPVSLAPNCRNNNGNLAGSTALATSGLETGRAFVEVVVTDAAGNATPSTRSTGFVLVDNKLPEFSGAVTGCGPNAPDPFEGVPDPAEQLPDACQDLNTIRVNLTEGVTGDFQPTDFFVDGDVVLVAQETQCSTPPAPNTKTFCEQVVLTLLNGFAEDDTPTVDYQFRQLPPTRARHDDAATNQLGLTDVLEAADGIVPDLPSLQTVTQDGVDSSGQPVSNAKGEQDGAFYTNQEAPTFRIGGVSANYTGIIAVDDNGIANFQAEPTLDNAGNLVPPDTVLAQCGAEGGTVDCTPASPIGGDATYNLLIASRDNEGNLSQGRGGDLAGLHALPVSLVIDNVAPQADAYTASTATPTIDVTFQNGADGTAAAPAEELATGRNFAEDWIVRDVLANGKFERFTVSGVAGADATRTISIGDSDYNAAAGEAEQVLYTFQGTADQRYQDRAGNYLGNFLLTPAI